MSASIESQDLPQWDLSDLYSAPDSPALQADLTSADTAARTFKEQYIGKLAAATGDDLAAAVGNYERIEEILSRIMSYAQ